MSDLDIIRKSNLDYYVRDPKYLILDILKKTYIDADQVIYTNQGIAKKYNKIEKTIGMTSSEYLQNILNMLIVILNELTNVISLILMIIINISIINKNIT